VASDPAAPPSRLPRVLRLARKELSEILRDRRTIITLVVMPLLLYPLMSIAFQQFFLASKLSPTHGVEYRLGFESKTAAQIFLDRVEHGDALLRHRAAAREAPSAPGTKHKGAGAAGPRFVYLIGTAAADLEPALQAGQLDLIIRLPDVRVSPDPSRDWDFAAEAVYRPSAPAALGALAYLEKRLASADEDDLRQRLNLPGVRPHIVAVRLRRDPLPEAAGQETLLSLPALVPLILILMTITGAVYPAIDLTAGERERNTLEILVAAPVPRFELLSGKYIAVVTVAVLTALVNVISMTLTLILSGLGPLIFEEGASPLLLVMLLGLLLLFAAFFSAVLLCLTSFARSFKEAQAYLIPLMLASLAPGILAMLPGLQLDLLLAVVPLVNVVLLARDLIAGTAEPALAAVVVLATLVYALAALSLAARVFGSENVLYSEQSGWSDLFRRPEEARPTAGVSAALWCLALVLPLHFALRAALPLVSGLGTAALLLTLTVGSILLFGALPCLFAYFEHVQIRTGFRLAGPRPAALVAGLILGCSLWPLVLQLLALAQTALPSAIQEQAAAAVRSMRAAGLLTVVPFVAAAAFEEFFFRGFLFQALRRVTGPAFTIAATALLFALTHVALGGALGLGQFLPSALLGLVLGVVCWLSGSVWPGLIMHVCHNALMVALTQGGFLQGHTLPLPVLATEVASLMGAILGPGPLLAVTLLFPEAGDGVPATWLGAGALASAAALLLLVVGGRRKAEF
jgi:sodium transport system permease protein